jgi:hypothetical protein
MTKMPARSASMRNLLFAIIIASGLPAFAVSAPPSPDVFAGVSLKILNAAAPPGSGFQMQVTLTEPKPILIGSSVFGLSPRLSVRGVVLPASPDAAGAAVRTPNGLALRFVSPSGDFGLSTVAPIIAVTLAVSASTPLGATAPLTLDANASTWTGPLGLYPQEIKPGTFLAKHVLAITDVLPGGGLLPAGSTISVLGVGFERGAVVEIDGTTIVSATFVSATRVDAVTGTPLQLDGKKVSVRNPDHARSIYYSYLRAASLGTSRRPLLAATDAVYPVTPLTFAAFPAAAKSATSFVGLALQNPSAQAAQVTVQLRTAAGVTASRVLTIPARTEIAREVSELFSGIVPGPDAVIAVSASLPVQMLSLLGDETAGTVTPVLPTVSF